MGDRTDESGMTVSCERAKGWPGQTITMTVDEAMEVAGLLNVLAGQRDLQADIRAAAMTWVKRLVHWPAGGQASE